jgi:arylsulfatase A-like enzyme
MHRAWWWSIGTFTISAALGIALVERWWEREPSPDEQAACRGCNVVLISVDTLRPDHLSMYGYARQTSPQLDAFFDGGVVYRQAVSPSPCTIPAVKQLLTGHLDAHGRRLAEGFGRTGYQTAAVASQHVFYWWNRLAEYNTGFSSFDLQKETEIDKYKLTTRTASDVSDRAIRAMESVAGKPPFFLWLHYFDPHDPYEPPAPHNLWRASSSELTDGDARKLLIAAAEGKRDWTREGRIFSPDDVAYFVGRYDGEVHYVDAEIGRVLRRLRELTDAKKTLVIFTADHGESIGDDGRWNHCKSLREVEVHVPLAIQGPPHVLAELRAGTPLTDPVSSLDIYPTVAALAGIPDRVLAFDGVELTRPHPDRAVFAVWEQEVAVWRKQLKLRGRVDGGEIKPIAVYDLGRDAGEREPLMPDGLVGPLLGLLRDRQPWLSAQVESTEDTSSALRSIGYVQ